MSFPIEYSGVVGCCSLEWHLLVDLILKNQKQNKQKCVNISKKKKKPCLSRGICWTRVCFQNEGNRCCRGAFLHLALFLTFGATVQPGFSDVKSNLVVQNNHLYQLCLILPLFYLMLTLNTIGLVFLIKSK